MNINRLLNNKPSDLSKGELAFANLSLALENDPRVLIIDDYGIYFDTSTEINFRKKIQLMNKNFGTTIILSSISDKILKLFTSVNIYLENGYVSKIRAGSSNRSVNNKYKTTRKTNERAGEIRRILYASRRYSRSLYFKKYDQALRFKINFESKRN